MNREMFRENAALLKDIYDHEGFIGLFSSIFFTAFTAKQREAILERDGHQCQATTPHNCNGTQYPLEVDHIIPQRYASEFGINPDYPENALTKCREAHDIKHPDRVKARKEYRTAKAQGYDSFAEMGHDRNVKLKERVIYWNPSNDRTDTVKAVQNTQKAKAKGWVFPDKPTPRKKKVESTAGAAAD